jgi:hypothetical protein
LRTEPMNVQTLDPVTAKEGLAPDVIKLDVQGAELEILQAGRVRWRRPFWLKPSWNSRRSMSVSQCLRTSTSSCDREDGFFSDCGEPRGDAAEGVEGRSTSGGQLMYGDALYYNAALLQNNSSQQLLVRWLMSLSAYRQYDMIVHLLNRNEATVSESSALIDILIPVSRRLPRS